MARSSTMPACSRRGATTTWTERSGTVPNSRHLTSFPKRTARWKSKSSSITSMHITDISATIYDAVGAVYPTEYDGNEITPLEGESIVPILKGKEWSRENPSPLSTRATEAFASAIGNS